ncbi:molybdopterin-guanine dinucleotide biosynthesis protein B [Paucisalibacillus globulus]|uniref:molybdopterin-guanine dinucleotide biosynthesis protein B n=1 Tax=Paucisalibacillus globulus TaxID=351095 RepID=UPI0004285E1C|nr:molybdopterin-guanine dinucleotide biosynthesis protein B [Paucisalibacillus globulus]
MKVLQIVGFKNSGKTTISKEVIHYFSRKGVQVGSLKNHGHGGIPAGIESTDSEQHRDAGSTVAGVLGENVFQLTHGSKWEISDMLEIYKKLSIELLVMEGFKELDFPKLVLLRNQDDLSLLTSLKNIIGIIKSNDLHIEDFDIPVFDNDNPEVICQWVYHHYLEGM